MNTTVRYQWRKPDGEWVECNYSAYRVMSLDPEIQVRMIGLTRAASPQMQNIPKGEKP